MLFSTQVGNLDIVANDWVQISDQVLPTGPLVGFVQVNQIDGNNTKQVQVKYSIDQLVWLDTAWITGNLRPVLPT